MSQARTTEKILHRISIDEENGIQNDILREFSMQVYHERFEITANGFFCIDLNLLASVKIILLSIF